MPDSDTNSIEQPNAAAAPADASVAPAVDLTGRDRIGRNVLASWAGQGVFIVAGFIMPRLINDSLGRGILGIWDLAWSLIAYSSLVQAGIGSSVNRYVARFRAAGQPEALAEAVSSVTCVLMAAAGAVVVLAIAAYLAIPRLFAGRLSAHEFEARWVTLILGCSLALRTAFGAYSGVITGYHRWALHNAILAGTYAAVVSAMAVVLSLGGGLVALALVNAGGAVCESALSVIVAGRLCRESRFRPHLASWPMARRMFGFGFKTFVPRISDLLLIQTTNLMVVGFLGAPMLALFTRPMSLVRHTRTLLTRFAFVLTPTAGSLQAMEKPGELRQLLITATRYGAFLLLPITLALLVFGDVLLSLWMGPEYANWTLVGILAGGHFPVLLQLPAICVLAGLNAHGRPALANLAAAAVSVGLVALSFAVFRGGLVGAALAMVLPIALVNGIYVPAVACRRVGLPVVKYWISSLARPLACAAPFAACLIVPRLLLHEHPIQSMAVSALCGAAVLAILYWFYAVPPRIQTRLSRGLGLRAACARRDVG